jgi:hypothetical protein
MTPKKNIVITPANLINPNALAVYFPVVLSYIKQLNITRSTVGPIFPAEASIKTNFKSLAE